MPALQLLIKPASGSCNMRCSYCFYYDISHNREVESYGKMSEDTLRHIVIKALDYAEYSCCFAFQGGEPTLAGLDFFRTVVELQKKYNHKNLIIQNALQTNGYLIDEAWCSFLSENHFLVGLSLDGYEETHDFYRKDMNGEGTFSRVMHAAELFDRFLVEYNILTVIHAGTAPEIRKIYEFYARRGFKYQQYITCLDPIREKQGGHKYSLTAEMYGKFLIELFDLWYKDLRRGKQPYIRQFENYVAILMGMQPENCEQRGVCSVQHVVEADGEVYPCDFYVLDDYRLGNLRDTGFDEIAAKRNEIGFISFSQNHDEECRRCQYFVLCRGGCARHRMEQGETNALKRNYFCKSYQMFFDHSVDRLKDIAYKIMTYRK